MRAREAMHSTAQCARKSSKSLTFTTIITATCMSKQSLCGLLSLHTRSVYTHTHTCEKSQKFIPNWSNKVLLRLYVNEWVCFFGSDTDTMIHTKLSSVKSEAYLIKSCGKFSVEFVSYFRTFFVHRLTSSLAFRSSAHHVACLSFYLLLLFIIFCVYTQAQRKTSNSSMWFTFMRIKRTERKTFQTNIFSYDFIRIKAGKNISNRPNFCLYPIQITADTSKHGIFSPFADVECVSWECCGSGSHSATVTTTAKTKLEVKAQKAPPALIYLLEFSHRTENW